MNGKEIASIAVTALVGFLFGIYIYFFGFLEVVEPQRPVQATASEFSIVSQVYGGCDMTSACPSFQILGDGSYRYLYTPAVGEEQVIRDGSIPRVLQRRIERTVSGTELEVQSKDIQPSFCNSYTDGIDITYRITINKEEYILDSCGTNIDPGSALWATLVSIWTYFETGEV
jgi:hypothetical protein